MNYAKLVRFLYPDITCIWEGDQEDYTKMKWISETVPKPTKKQLEDANAAYLASIEEREAAQAGKAKILNSVDLAEFIEAVLDKDTTKLNNLKAAKDAAKTK